MVQLDLDHSREEGCIFCGIYDRVTGEMMGIVDFMTTGFEGDPALAFLSLLMIAAPFRGQGLGEAVVQAVEDEIRRAGSGPGHRIGRAGQQPGWHSLLAAHGLPHHLGANLLS